MIYTLTLNPAIDKTVVIPSFSANAVNRVQSVRTDVGGKGINVSKCLLSLGCKSTAVAFWGGTSGAQGVRFLKDSGIPSLTVQVAEETRTNLKIADPELGQNTDINEPGPHISSEELASMVKLLEEHIQPGDLLVLSGSIPRGVEPSIYRELILRHQQRGAKVFLDADGLSLREGITAAPYLVKPNIRELSDYMGRELRSEEDLLSAARQLLRSGIREIVISMGADGGLLVNSAGAYRAYGLKVPVRSTVGAGDSMVAALAWGIQRGMCGSSRLALAVAISAASVMCTGTQAPEADTIKELMDQVKIEEVF